MRSKAAASWDVRNLRRKVARANRFPVNTCPASRHVRLMADGLTSKHGYSMLAEEPEHCAQSMYATVAALWRARTKIGKLEARLKKK